MLVPVPARRFLFSCLALPLFVSVGCGSDLADDPLFNDQQAAVQRMDDDLGVLRSQVEDLNRGMNDLLTEVENLKGEPLTGNVSGQRLEQRVEVLEAAIAEYNQALSKIRSEVSDMEDAVASAPTRPSAPSRPASVRSESTASSSVPSSSRVTLTRTPAPSKPEPTPTPRPQGFYHTVQTGETVAALAGRFGVSEASIRKANHIPEGRNPYPGQQIYIVR